MKYLPALSSFAVFILVACGGGGAGAGAGGSSVPSASSISSSTLSAFSSASSLASSSANSSNFSSSSISSSAASASSAQSSASSAATSSVAADVTVLSSIDGTTPLILGYNNAHAMQGSNAQDWWRYSGVNGARVFLSASQLQSGISSKDGGITTKSGFIAQAAAVRANASNAAQTLSNTIIDFSSFEAQYAQMQSGNRYILAQWFPQLRALGVDILVNITASTSTFPLSSDTEYGNMWRIWQHYYAQAFLLSRDYGVHRFSMFNEPNGNGIAIDNWHLRLRIASDAIQAAVADMNTRYGKRLAVEVLAPNTANGATKYDDYTNGLYWGQYTVQNRHKDIWNTTQSSWKNFHVYNYQKYSMYTNDTGSSSGYIEDLESLRTKIAADTTGETAPALVLTEFNVRTNSSYDGKTENADTPSDYAALGANAVALSSHGAQQLYLFKFGQGASDAGSSYAVDKNGTHYVDNSSTGLNNYGGASATAEVWRLFNKASGSARSRLKFSSNQNSNVWLQITQDASNNVYLFIANKNTAARSLTFDLGTLALPEGSLATLEEVSEAYRGGIKQVATVQSHRLNSMTVAGNAVALISIYPAAKTTATQVTASADTTLIDGSYASTATASSSSLQVRADGTTSGRKAALIKFTLPSNISTVKRVLLSLNAASSASSSAAIYAQVYGVKYDNWSESSRWQDVSNVLSQNVAAGNQITNNVIANPGTINFIQGQLLTDSTASSEKWLDVTDLVKSQSDGAVSFLIAQVHRWDQSLQDGSSGDTQAAGIVLGTREGSQGARLYLYY